MKKKILLFGPFGDFGGRELEGSFIASVLSSKYDVDICTSSFVNANSQIFDFNKNQKVFSIKELVFKRYLIIRITCFLSYLKNQFKGILSTYANNAIAKRYFNYDKKVNNILEELIPEYDLIFICAQFSSSYMETIVTLAKEYKTKIVFRTTGQITDIKFNYLNGVDLFIHHSVNNAKKLKIEKFEIVDQCSFIEDQLLSLMKNNSNKIFLMLGRLSSEKGFEQGIEFFLRTKKASDVLIIAGEGELKEKLQFKYKNHPKIKFIGFIKAENLNIIFEKTDCLIIPSLEESGPLVGIEAMAAAKPIISTKVGAMPERLDGTLNDLWFDINDYNSFEKAFNTFKAFDKNYLIEISESLRNKYKKTYAIEVISNRYIKAIDKVLES